MKNMFAEILPILKRPVTESQNIASKNSPLVGLEFMIAKAVVVVLIILIGLSKMSNALGGFGGMIDIPYMKIVFIALLLTLGVDALEAVVMKAISAVSNCITTTGAMFTSVGTRALYDTIIILLTGILCVVSVQFALVFYAGASIILPYVQYGAYRAVVSGDENKKVYAYFIAKLCVSIVVFLVVYLSAQDIVTSIAGSSMNNMMNGIESLF